MISLSPVLPTPRNTAITSIDVTSSEALNTNTFTYADLRLTRDNATNDLITNTVTISLVASNQYRINGLATLTDAPGNYLLTLDTTASKTGRAMAAPPSCPTRGNDWEPTPRRNSPPLPNQSVPEGNLLTFIATAIDADIPTNVLTFSLIPVRPAAPPSIRTAASSPGHQPSSKVQTLYPLRCACGTTASDHEQRPYFLHYCQRSERAPDLGGHCESGGLRGNSVERSELRHRPQISDQPTDVHAGCGRSVWGAHPSRGTFTWSPPPAAAGTTIRSPSSSPTTERRPSPMQSPSPSSSETSLICLWASPSFKPDKPAASSLAHRWERGSNQPDLRAGRAFNPVDQSLPAKPRTTNRIVFHRACGRSS